MQTEPSTRRRGAVAVVIRRGKLLVIRRAEGIAAPGAFCFPGGGIEEGETEQQALTREIEEELGVHIEPLRRLWRSITDWQVELFWWLAAMEESAEVRPNRAEVAEVHWLRPVEIGELPDLLSSNHEFLNAWQSGQFDLDGIER